MSCEKIDKVKYISHTHPGNTNMHCFQGKQNEIFNITKMIVVLKEKNLSIATNSRSTRKDEPLRKKQKGEIAGKVSCYMWLQLSHEPLLFEMNGMEPGHMRQKRI